MRGATIGITGITKSFGSFEALKGVSLDVREGEFFSLLGPSGCGKTTLLRIIGGFEEPDRGSVEIDGKDVLPLPPNMRFANTVFQNYALFPHLSVYENVAFPLRLKKTRRRSLDELVMHYLRLVELDGHAAKMPSMLSGGQKQRVAIARALINQPAVLLLDEPLSALDAKLRHHMLMELDAIHDKVGLTFIYVTHDQAEALSVSDRIAVMDHGRVLQVGSPREIYETPATGFVAQFIGEMNMIPGIVTSEEGRWYVAGDEGVGRVAIADPGRFRAGDRVTLTVRPERLRIGLAGRPPREPEPISFEGEIDEAIYSGFLSKYYIRLPGGKVLRAFRQHREQGESEEISWGARVRVSWNPRDAFIIGGETTA